MLSLLLLSLLLLLLLMRHLAAPTSFSSAARNAFFEVIQISRTFG